MKFWFAPTDVRWKVALLKRCSCRGLQSFVYQYQEAMGVIELMLDSGAFSAWRQGTKISIEEYAAFIHKHRDAFTVVASLDVIPGKPGEGQPTAVEIERAAEEGWRNWLDLTAALAPDKIIPIHTYHYREDPKWLRRLIEKADYFALGGTVGLSSGVRKEFFDSIMPLLTDSKGFPIRKFHGFGMTDLNLIRRYPWHSVDSTSWLMASSFGASYLSIDGKTHIIIFSEDSTAQAEPGARHFKRYKPVEQRRIVQEVKAHGLTIRELAENFCRNCETTFDKAKDGQLPCGCSEDKGSFGYIQRSNLNIDFFLALERELIDPTPWRPEHLQGGLGL